MTFELRPTSAPAVANFASLAASWCDLVARCANLDRVAFLQQAQSLLPQLYSAALALPDPGSLFPDDASTDDDPVPERPADPDRLAHPEWSDLYAGLRGVLREWCDYREVFDPYDWADKEEVTGSLADDIADIYGDLRNGLRKWQRGDSGGALWEWRFNFQYHWGEHATGAIRAIHALVTRHDLAWDSDMNGREHR